MSPREVLELKMKSILRSIDTNVLWFLCFEMF
jgi:hypothetical protein